jgi:hypothetical protein
LEYYGWRIRCKIINEDAGSEEVQKVKRNLKSNQNCINGKKGTQKKWMKGLTNVRSRLAV